MKKAIPILVFLFWMLPAMPTASGADRPDGRIALIGDPHLPGKHLSAKERLLKTINGWDGIDRVVVLGDLCEETGTEDEYAAVKRFFAPLHHPLRPITGNHDYLYEDQPDARGRKVKASPEVRRRKLARFVETFGLEALYRSERLGRYRLLYLSTDALEGSHLAQMSEEQLFWMQKELVKNQRQPTIVFFHAPLAGTLKPYNSRANTPGFIAQPAAPIRRLIREHPQIFLWAAGHMHVPATNESYCNAVNLYEGRVTVVHNTDLQRRSSWTNVLDLHSDRVVVRTYDHGKKVWRPDLERTVRVPFL